MNKDTRVKYINKARAELWGKCQFREPAHGKIGISKRSWAKKYCEIEDGDIKICFKPLTVEDMAIKREIGKRYFGGDVVSIEDQDGVIHEWINDEITGDEAFSKTVAGGSKKETKGKFLNYLRELANELECDAIVPGTWVKDGIFVDEDNNVLYEF